jgi:hypothetical protein
LVEKQEAVMPRSVPKNQMRALAIAMVGATVAAVATMFIPASILGNVTSSTGLSELFPAAAPPLGDTARALIAFGSGALTLAILAFVLLRHDMASADTGSLLPASQWTDENEASSFTDRLARLKLPQMAMPKAPWTKNEDDITDLADLPKLRNGDGHPDAPPRRPLVASQDLPILDLAEMPQVPVAATPTPTIEEVVAVQQPVMPAVAESGPMNCNDAEPTLAEMVAQLEAAVAERQKQLVELEAVATELAASRPVVQHDLAEEQLPPDSETIARNEGPVYEQRQVRPSFEVVPSPTVRDDDMDSALTAALATLHRMNATGR